MTEEAEVENAMSLNPFDTPKEVPTLVALAYATFVSNSVASAVPCKHFAVPPYRLEPMNDKVPDGLQCVMNANGFNCLSFTDCPGAKFAPKEIAQEIVNKWNGVK
jgi:hypothetical protein